MSVMKLKQAVRPVHQYFEFIPGGANLT